MPALAGHLGIVQYLQTIMIVDSHTHILPDEFRVEKGRFLERDGTFKALFSSPKAAPVPAEALLSEMRRAGVDHSVVAGYGWTDLDTARLSNDYLLSSAADSEGRLIPLCSVNPLWGREAVMEIERCVAAGAKGIGELHPDSQNFLNVDFATLAPFFSAAKALELPVLIHTSEPVGHSYPGKGAVTPEYSLALAQAFPSNVFVFAHFGGGLPFYSLMPEVRRQLKNVYFDSAAFPFLYTPEVFPASCAAAGADKVLFASDFPMVSQERALAEFRTSTVRKSDCNLVLGENARRLWNIS
ncbi:MAG: amidohydrolase family protein [Chloroflexi bacterium]|nr:amidohydrolase family protein [Chloroflexota bacterium]